MNHVPSDQSFYIESEEEDDRKDYEEEDGDQSHSDSSDENQPQTKPSSYTTAWPQSYRSNIISISYPYFRFIVIWPQSFCICSNWSILVLGQEEYAKS